MGVSWWSSHGPYPFPNIEYVYHILLSKSIFLQYLFHFFNITSLVFCFLWSLFILGPMVKLTDHYTILSNWPPRRTLINLYFTNSIDWIKGLSFIDVCPSWITKDFLSVFSFFKPILSVHNNSTVPAGKLKVDLGYLSSNKILIDLFWVL